MQSSIQNFFERYCIRPDSPDLQLLFRIASAFSHLPYENVTKILKKARSSGSESQLRMYGEVLEDHLKWNTGGTCFSLCNALLAVLKESGYEAFIAMGDMHYGENIHCAVIVRLTFQIYLLDPGYLLHQPIVLPARGQEVTVRTSMNTVILKGESEKVVSLYTLESGQQKWRYRLRAWPIDRAEFEQHWIRSFSLNSMETILLSRLNETGRIYFRKECLEHVSPSFREKKIIRFHETRVLSSIFGVPADLIAQAQRSLSGR